MWWIFFMLGLLIKGCVCKEEKVILEIILAQPATLCYGHGRIDRKHTGNCQCIKDQQKFFEQFWCRRWQFWHMDAVHLLFAPALVFLYRCLSNWSFFHFSHWTHPQYACRCRLNYLPQSNDIFCPISEFAAHYTSIPWFLLRWYSPVSKK